MMKRFWLVFMLRLMLVCGGCLDLDVSLLGDDDEGGNSNDAEGNSDPSQLPGTENGGWADVAYGVAGHLMGAERGVVFYGFDTLAYPDSTAELTARLQSAKNIQGIANATLGFYRGEKLIGKAKTNKGGYASVKLQTGTTGTTEYAVKVLSVPESVDQSVKQVTPASLLVAVRRKNVEIVVIDLDHTAVESGFFRVLVGGAKPMPGASKAIQRIEEDYQIVYLTHRPDLLASKSKRWLTQHGFPRAPLMVSELRQAFGDSGKFKTARLSALKDVYPNVEIGIGDKFSDAQAYVNNGLTAYLIPDYDPNDLEDVREVIDELRRLNGKGRLNVVDGWSEVPAGIYRGKRFPPEEYIRNLRNRRSRLRARERREGDDDDDDEEEDDD
ncbi:MAG: hypothetical protein ACLFVU_14595 [Phycisphaerae bacterium]